MKKNNGLYKMMVMMLVLIISIAMLSGCSGSDGQNDASAGDVATEETQDSGDSSSDGSSSGDWNDVEEQPDIDIATLGGPGGVDVDLTKLSSTMVYAVVNDMLVKPNSYIGKKVRMNGAMATYHDEETGNTYYACIIKDATACCAQGIEFVTTDEYSESDFPAEGEDLTVVGAYDLYEEGGYQYCILKDAVLE